MNPWPDSLIDTALNKALLTAECCKDCFAESLKTVLLRSVGSREFIGYLSLIPVTCISTGNIATSDAAGCVSYPYLLRFSSELPPTEVIGRVCDFSLNVVGWRSRLVPFFKSLCVMRDTYCPLRIVDIAPEVYD